MNRKQKRMEAKQRRRERKSEELAWEELTQEERDAIEEEQILHMKHSRDNFMSTYLPGWNFTEQRS